MIKGVQIYEFVRRIMSMPGKRIVLSQNHSVLVKKGVRPTKKLQNNTHKNVSRSSGRKDYVHGIRFKTA